MKNYDIKINGKSFHVGIESVNPDLSAKVTMNGKEYLVQVKEEDGTLASIESVAGARAAASASATVASASSSAVSAVAAAPSAQDNAPLAPGESVITSPLPGVIIGINVNVGDSVKAGQCLAVLEAMKMENNIEAERAGIVKKIYVQKGDSILEGAKIIMIG